MEDSQGAKRRKDTFYAQTFVQAVHQKSLQKKKEVFYTGSHTQLGK